MAAEIHDKNFASARYRFDDINNATYLTWQFCFIRDEVHSHQATAQKHSIYNLTRGGCLFGVFSHTADATIKHKGQTSSNHT